MKIKNLLILSLLTITSLSSCVFSNNDSNQEVPEAFVEFLTKAKNSYKIKAVEKEVVSKTNGNEMFTNEYQYNITSLRGDRPSFSETLVQQTSEGTQTATIKYVKNERGYASLEGINYKNEVFLTEATDSNGYKMIYDKNFPNPFEYLTAKDFKVVENKNGDNKELVAYLNNDKLTFFAKYLVGISYELESASFLIEDSGVKNLSFKAKQFESRYEDAYTGLYIPVYVNYEMNVIFENVGDAIFDGAKPHKSKNSVKEAALKKALTELGNNYTIVINEHYQGDQANTDYDSYWYFDGGNAIYHQQHLNDTSRKYDLYYKKDLNKSDDLLYLYDFNETTNVWDYNEPIYSQSYNVKPKKYSDLDTKATMVDPKLFEYDEENNKYVVSDSYVKAYLGNAILPGCYQIRDFTIGNGNKAEITLTSDGKIDSMVVGFYDVDSQDYDVSREYSLRFINVGKTTIPSWVEEK